MDEKGVFPGFAKSAFSRQRGMDEKGAFPGFAKGAFSRHGRDG
jgi:hypothetical protein